MKKQMNSNPYKEVLLRGVWEENPVFVQVLGLCPTLAVSNSVKNALAMSLAVLFVLVCSNVLVSLVRRIVIREIRIAIFILIIATFVTVVDYVVQAVSVPLYKAMGLFISLIVVNCIILARAEAFASRNSVLKAMLDGVGMAAGFSVALLALGSVREILGAGTFLGYPLFGKNYEPWVIFLLPSGGFLTLGTWLLLFAWWEERRKSKKRELTES